jgi:CheY-like chemotaxis protein
MRSVPNQVNTAKTVRGRIGGRNCATDIENFPPSRPHRQYGHFCIGLPPGNCYSEKVPVIDRVLIVEDHEIVRRGICALLSRDPTLVVIFQTADGEEAVKKAQELQPTLILLDVTLPGMSGIEAAYRLREVSPASKIIFLSQHDSLQIVKNAFKTGGHGYVLKSDAALDLLDAIRCVREGNQFVSERLLTQGWRPDA